MNITWKIGGEAGFGIMTTGMMFSRLATRHGYHIFDYVEFPSLIRGGHNVYEVCVGDEDTHSQEKKIDVLFALNQETIDKHKNEFKDGGILVYDPETAKVDANANSFKNIIVYTVPLTAIVRDNKLLKVMENNVALGITTGIFGMDINILNSLIADTFSEKGDKIILPNQQAAKLGFDYVVKNPPQGFDRKLIKRTAQPKIVITGNEAYVLGAIASGCKFYAAYPMTPMAAALVYMAEVGPKYGVVVKHAEDEISVINMAIGASYTGVRSMINTAGGGFSLMVEGLGLAGITETPLVIVMAQRPGPATGLPTYTGQGDLKFLINASQDEFPRVILAPGDVEEAFYLTVEAFNIADKLQTPVFVLVDKFLCESHKSAPIFDQTKITIDRGNLLSKEIGDTVENYMRYQDTPSGISPRNLPGMKKAIATINSYEHTEYGFSTEDITDRIKQVEKRNRKLDSYKTTILKPTKYGDENAQVTLIAWGSTKGPILQALKRLKSENFNQTVNFIHLNHVWPLPKEALIEELNKCQKVLLVEGNSQAQMASLIREQTGIEIKNKLLKYDGRPFYPEEIIEKIKEISI